MRVIRAERNIFVPQNPEQPDKNSMRLVSTGLVALIPECFELPKDAFKDLGKVKIKKSSSKEEQDEE